MRISTITNWAYGATFLLSLASGASLYLASGAEDRERAAVAERMRFDGLTESVVEDSLRLSEAARDYVISGNPGDLVSRWEFRRFPNARRMFERSRRHRGSRAARRSGSMNPREDIPGLVAIHGSTGFLFEAVAKSVALNTRMVSVLPARIGSAGGWLPFEAQVGAGSGGVPCKRSECCS